MKRENMQQEPIRLYQHYLLDIGYNQGVKLYVNGKENVLNVAGGSQNLVNKLWHLYQLQGLKRLCEHSPDVQLTSQDHSLQFKGEENVGKRDISVCSHV